MHIIKVSLERYNMATGYAHYIFCGGTIVTMEKENP